MQASGPDPPKGQREQHPPRKDSDELSRVSESLVVLVRDLQRQNLALAGHIGYLQSQLGGMQQKPERVGQTEREMDTTESETVSKDEHEAALREVEELRRSVQMYREELAARPTKKKRWWRRG
jgi:hypothetical protein